MKSDLLDSRQTSVNASFSRSNYHLRRSIGGSAYSNQSASSLRLKTIARGISLDRSMCSFARKRFHCSIRHQAAALNYELVSSLDYA
jgi:hypothetical protein